MKAFFVQFNICLKIALICLFVINIVIENLIDSNDLLLDFFCRRHDILPQSFDTLESATRALKNSLGDEHIGIAHELLIFAYLRVEEIWENLSRNHFVLQGVILRNGRLSFGTEFPVGLLGIEAETSTFFVLISTG